VIEGVVQSTARLDVLISELQAARDADLMRGRAAGPRILTQVEAARGTQVREVFGHPTMLTRGSTGARYSVQTARCVVSEPAFSGT
jgi:hypothetical protein